jgi:probable HAF family extracellular repeat protein
MDSNFRAVANAINGAGQVVGELDRFKSHRRHGFVWTQSTGMRDLDAMVLSKFGKFETAVGVNSWGEIIAYGIPLNLVLTPIMHTTLVSSPNPSIVGQSVTFSAQVGSTTQGPPPDGEPVTFNLGLKVLAVVPLAGGVATFSTSGLKAGTRVVKATYGGDAHYAGSISKVTQIVQP